MNDNQNPLELDKASSMVNHHLLRIITCGSVDDGKSTLIGRLLYENGHLPADIRDKLRLDSQRFGTTGADELDYALLVDGLEAEREQGITIDVAWRYITTTNRRIIIADTPGHDRYTRNMATAASNADLAILLIDASQGIMPQTRRHAMILSLFGVKHMLLAVNKMDKIGYQQEVYDQLVTEFGLLAKTYHWVEWSVIPLSAKQGDNVSHLTLSMQWYQGPNLVRFLDEFTPKTDVNHKPLVRFPIQRAHRPDSQFRGYQGSLQSQGELKVGDEIIIMPSRQISTITAIHQFEGQVSQIASLQPATLVLQDQLDISRGEIICPREQPARVASHFNAYLLWFAEEKLYAGRRYDIKLATANTSAYVSEIIQHLDIGNQLSTDHKSLACNEIAKVSLITEQPLAFDAYQDNHATGAFIFIDRQTKATIAAGCMLEGQAHEALLHHDKIAITGAMRAAKLAQQPKIIWLTGLPRSGKTSIALALEQALFAKGQLVYRLDFDNIRYGLNSDLGFSKPDRVEHLRRVAEVAKLLLDAGLYVIVSFVSPFEAERAFARSLVAPDQFIEVFVDTPLAVCEARDVDGVFQAARTGNLENVSGVNAPYQPPQNAELVLDGASKLTPHQLAQQILKIVAE